MKERVAPCWCSPSHAYRRQPAAFAPFELVDVSLEEADRIAFALGVIDPLGKERPLFARFSFKAFHTWLIGSKVGNLTSQYKSSMKMVSETLTFLLRYTKIARISAGVTFKRMAFLVTLPVFWRIQRQGALQDAFNPGNDAWLKLLDHPSFRVGKGIRRNDFVTAHKAGTHVVVWIA